MFFSCRYPNRIRGVTKYGGRAEPTKSVDELASDKTAAKNALSKNALLFGAAILYPKEKNNMIKHIVCFKLKDKTKKEEAKNLLLSMRGKVPTVKALEAGTDFLSSPRSYDVFLSVVLEDKAALDAYQSDFYHVSVVKKFMHAEAESSVAVDFEIEDGTIVKKP